MYKLFQPWLTPVLPVSRDETRGVGRVERGGRLQVRLQPLGQAQAWTGETYGLLWECYLHQTRRRENWPEELALFWQAVEDNLRVQKIFTHLHDPAFLEGYVEFLKSVGYGPDIEYRRWWSKETR